MSINREDWIPCFVDVEKGLAFFDGIFIEADSMNNPRWDRVLPIIEEEHILMCREMKRHGRVKQGQFALDIGTGNGILAIWAAKQGCKVLAIDINPRAISIAKKNAKKNDIHIYKSFEQLLELPDSEAGICFLLEEFKEDNASKEGTCFSLEQYKSSKGFEKFRKKFGQKFLFDLVLFVPAYNLAFKGITLPLHASAGEDGQQEFNKYIRLIPNLLKDNGSLIGNHLSTVTEQKDIKAISRITDAFDNKCQIFYSYIIDAEREYPTADFLKGQYQSFLNKSEQHYLAKTKNIQELEKYMNDVSQDNPHLSLIYYEVVKKSKIETENNIQVYSIPYALPSYINWEHRIWLHRHIVEYTAERNYSLVHSLFMDVFPVNYPNFQPLNCESLNNQWEKSLLKTIDDYLKRKTSWSNFQLFDLIIIDTAPMQNNIEGFKHLSNEMKIWSNQSLENINKENNYKFYENLLQEYQKTITTLQKAKLSPFLHPCFSGILPIEDWGLSFPFTLINKEGEYINLYSKDEIEQEKHYELWFESVNKKLNNFKQSQESSEAELIIDARIGYSTTNFRKLSVPNPREFYQELLEPQRFPKALEYKSLLDSYGNSLIKAIQDCNISLNLKEQISNLLKIDLELIVLTMHKKINKTINQVFKKFQCLNDSNSILIGLPLGIQLDTLDIKTLTENELPDSYRGCIWIYARTSDDWSIEHEKFIDDVVKFSGLLYIDKYSLELGKLEKQKAKQATSARLALLHQLPKDLTALDEDLSEYSRKITNFIHTYKDKYPELESELPKFSKPDSLGVTLMFTKAAQDRQLMEMPKDCANILYGEWNQTTIENFVNRVVWTQARNRALNYEEVKEKIDIYLGSTEIEKEYPKPKLILNQSFELDSFQGIYPLIILALRSAYQHSYKMTLLSDNPSEGKVEIKYENQELIITNTGLSPSENNSSQSQTSWERDVKIMEGLTGKWKFHNFGNEYITRCSIYDSQIERWTTKIIRTN